MKVQVQQGNYLRQDVASAEDITYVVIFGDDGSPILVAEQVGRDHVQVTKATEPMFQHLLHRLGIKAGGVVVT